MFKKSLALLLVLTMISLIGCGGGGNGDDSPVGPGEDETPEEGDSGEENIAGTWSGQYSGGLSGNVTLVITQNSPNIQVQASGTDDDFGNWAVNGEGTITNNTIEVQFEAGSIFGSMEGTLSGNTISGTWAGQAGGHSASGNLSVTKQ